MKKMKKLTVLLLVVVFSVATFAGCSTAELSSEAPTESLSEAPAESLSEAPAESSSESSDGLVEAGGSGEAYKVGVVIKVTGNPFYEAVDAGMQKAASEMENLTYSMVGPTDATAELQVEIINNFVNEGVDAIVVAANDPDALAPALKEAMDKGIPVVSFDSDVAYDARMLHISNASEEQVGLAHVDAAYELAGGSGDIAILSAAPTATNQNAWIDAMKDALENDPKYADLNLVATVYGDDKPDKSYQETQGLIKSYPDLKVIMTPTTVATTAAGKAVTDLDMIDSVYVTGLGLPSETGVYIKNGASPLVYLWNPVDLGYVSLYAALAVLEGETTGVVGETFSVGELGEREILENNISLLGGLTTFNKDNVDEFTF